MILLKMEDLIVLISLSTGKYNWVYSYNQYVKLQRDNDIDSKVILWYTINMFKDDEKRNK